MKTFYLTLLAVCGFLLPGVGQRLYNIRAQKINPDKELGFDSSYSYSFKRIVVDTLSVDSFSISNQITFGEYKRYLLEIKNDSSYSFYLLQLPDSSILSRQDYIKYTTDNKYNNYPVVGIRWNAAMNFCKWKTLKENSGDSICFIYRLPKISEWLSAYKFLKDNLLINDFNKNFSDWTVNTHFEGGTNLDKDIILLTNDNDPPRLSRANVIGNSFLFQRQILLNPIGYFKFNGFRQVAFRVVKIDITRADSPRKSIKSLLNYWNIKNDY
ncbi:SUMF1/EgtB/PvdO family nonheme iron enzyme [Ferruginibacter albus]|uniref:SUMF1/EgtB/PvdO family nonheme iron enzyme n=1 Tax=Ferruginibacter albus TaxID=2875540 RepID=UPI001CC57325|nr:SUMF1/EgtB/PvdO family nonheme iron enzyme [Ferruginibacter albus]UAY51354.1 formylglycine-generating enzyme family protein [Ferruginibacter albus]